MFERGEAQVSHAQAAHKTCASLGKLNHLNLFIWQEFSNEFMEGMFLIQKENIKTILIAIILQLGLLSLLAGQVTRVEPSLIDSAIYEFKITDSLSAAFSKNDTIYFSKRQYQKLDDYLSIAFSTFKIKSKVFYIDYR
ncbi:MAG: hypothetical protein QM734_14500, partial [Cyclobacteriaceae bacterium]